MSEAKSAEEAIPKYTAIVMVRLGDIASVQVECGDIHAVEDAAIDVLLAREEITLDEIEGAATVGIFEGWPTVFEWRG